MCALPLRRYKRDRSRTRSSFRRWCIDSLDGFFHVLSMVSIGIHLTDSAFEWLWTLVRFTLLWYGCLWDTMDGFMVAGAMAFGVGFGWIGTGVEITGVVWIVGMDAICRICCSIPAGTWADCCSAKWLNREPRRVRFSLLNGMHRVGSEYVSLAAKSRITSDESHSALTLIRRRIRRRIKSVQIRQVVVVCICFYSWYVSSIRSCVK